MPTRPPKRTKSTRPTNWSGPNNTTGSTRPRKPTIQAIADRVGVNKSTVSRALHNPGRVSRETRDKIIDTANAMGYFQWPAPQNPSDHPSSDIGLLANSALFSSPDRFYTEIIRGCLEEANRLRCHVIVNAMDCHGSDVLSPLITEAKVKRLIIIPSAPDHVQRAVLQQDMATVAIDLQTPSAHFPTIYPDSCGGVQTLVSHLADLGHRSIGFIASAAHHSFRSRFEGYVTGLNYHHLEYAPDRVFLDRCPEDDERIHKVGPLGVDKLLSLPRHRRPTAVICGNDPMAIAVMRSLHQAGLRIPQDISVAGFDNIDWASQTTPALTTVEISKLNMGALAVQLVLSMPSPLAPSWPTKIIVPTKLVVRHSTAPPH